MSEAKTLSHQPKIAIVGSGQIGLRLLAELRNQYPDSEIVVHNRESATGTGAAIGADQALGIKTKFRRGQNEKPKFTFTTDEQLALKDADIVVVTAGKPRTDEKQTRLELAASNIPIIDNLAMHAKIAAEENPEHKTNYIIITNPSDIIAQRFKEQSGIPDEQIIGLGGELDIERLRQSIRLNMHVDYNDIRGGRIIGEHGPTMVPLVDEVEVRRNGEWQKLTDQPEYEAILHELIAATEKGGARLTKWRGTSDDSGPAMATALMIQEIVDARWGDHEASQPVTASVLHPESGVYAGQTVRFNRDGTYTREEMELTPANQEKFDASLAEIASSKQKVYSAAARVSAPISQAVIGVGD